MLIINYVYIQGIIRPFYTKSLYRWPLLIRAAHL